MGDFGFDIPLNPLPKKEEEEEEKNKSEAEVTCTTCPSVQESGPTVKPCSK